MVGRYPSLNGWHLRRTDYERKSYFIRKLDTYRPDSELELFIYLIIMKNINRALIEIEKEGFSHITKGALKIILITQHNIVSLKDKNIIHFFKRKHFTTFNSNIMF